MNTSVRPSNSCLERARLTRPLRRGEGDRGEGIISVAIAVLIMAFLGAAMWVAFSDIWSTTESNTRDQVEIIGS